MISEAYIQETGRMPREKKSKKRKQNATKTHWVAKVSMYSMMLIMTMQNEQAAAEDIMTLRRPTRSMKK